MNKSFFPCFIGLIFFFGSGYVSASHVNLSYSSVINFVIVDDGSAVYSGTAVGDIVTGSFNYGTNDSDAVITPDSAGETDYYFSASPYNSQVSSPSSTASTNDANIFISNNNPIGINSLNTVGLVERSILAGFTISQGDLFDGWSAEGQIGNLVYGFQIYSFSNLNWTTDQSYFAIPPDTGDLVISYIFEKDAAGNLIYAALGEVNNHAFTVVPLPTAFWLFGSSFLGLVGVSIRKKAI